MSSSTHSHVDFCNSGSDSGGDGALREFLFFRNRLYDLFGAIEKEFEALYAENINCECHFYSSRLSLVV